MLVLLPHIGHRHCENAAVWANFCSWGRVHAAWGEVDRQVMAEHVVTFAKGGNRTYIITASRMISGLVRKYRKWLRLVIRES